MNLFKNLAVRFLLVAFLLATSAARAEEGGEGGKGLNAKVGAIVVNLLGPTRQYIQVEIVLKLAKPELGERIKLYMPAIRHKMILLLSNKSASQLGPTEGKQTLIKESKDAINQALELTDKDGVTEVLFDSFIIQ